MRDMWGEKSSGRTRFNALVITISILLICAILGTTIFFNWNYIVSFFKDAKNKIKNWFKDDEIVKEIHREEVSLEAEDFNELVIRIQELETLSKNYDPTSSDEEAQLRAMIYIRSGKYNDRKWEHTAGEIDSSFASYVERNQGEYDLVGLKYVKDFVVPATGEKVDLRHMFATMNVVALGVQTIADAAGWGGDLVELMNQFKNTTLTGNELITAIEEQFDGDSASSSFSGEDVCADFDAVNLFKIQSESSKTIAESFEDYYTSLTKNSRIQQFKENNFSGTFADLNSFTQSLKSNLKSNIYIVALANSKEQDFLTKYEIVVDACIQVFAEYIY